MYRGFFINLDRNAARRNFMTRHLAELGLTAGYERFPAIDGATTLEARQTTLCPGNLGVWLSELRILRTAAPANVDIHILQDDAVLCRDFAARADALLSSAPREADLIFTDVAVAPETRLFLAFHERLAEFRRTGRVQVLPLRGIEWAGASSFFVRAASVARCAELLGDNWKQGVPDDLYLRHLVDRDQLAACVTVPFLSALSPHSVASDIRGPQDRARRVMDLYRRAFFIDADHPALLAEMRSLTAGATTPPLADLFLESTRYALSDQWEPF